MKMLLFILASALILSSCSERAYVEADGIGIGEEVYIGQAE